MNDFLEGIVELLELIGVGFLNGLRVCFFCVCGLVWLASLFLTIVLLCHLCSGQQIPWYEIIAPIVMFLGIGIFIELED